MERQLPELNEINFVYFKYDFTYYKNLFLLNSENTFYLSKYTFNKDKEIYSKIQNYDGENLNMEDMQTLLTEAYLRLNSKTKKYICDTIIYEENDNESYGMVNFKGSENGKATMNIFKPNNYYQQMNKYDKTYNKENIGMALLSTVIHENQHLNQILTVEKALTTNDNLTDMEKVLSLVYFSSTSDLITIPYSSQLIEFDANFTAVKKIFEMFKDGTLKDDYNNKMSLYNDLLILLHYSKENVIEDNIKFVDILKDFYLKINDNGINNLATNVTEETIENFKKELDARYEELQQIRNELETYFVDKMTDEMKSFIKNYKDFDKNNISFKNFEEFKIQKEFIEKDCHNFKRMLSYALNATKNKSCEDNEENVYAN